MRRRALPVAIIVLCVSGSARADDDLVRNLVATRARADAVVASDLVIEETSRSRTHDLQLAAGGQTWRYFVREPRRRAGRLAAVLLLAGVETGRESLRFVAERDDMVLLGMDYPLAGVEQLVGWDLVRALPALRADALATIEGAALGLTYLVRRTDVDAGRLVLLGVSFGSIFAVALGAHDPRPSAVVLLYGGGDLALLARRNLRTPWWLPSFLVGPIVRAYFGELEPLSNVAWIAPRTLLMVSSVRDEMFPPLSARALFERAGEPKKMLWYDTGHMDLFEPELLRSLTADVVEQLELAGLLGARPPNAR